MKKVILTFLVTAVASIGINQLISSTNANNNIKIEESINLNQNDHLIEQLNQEYYSRTNILNQTIENNLINSIILLNNEITINYQNLKQELYSEIIYQTLLSFEYLNNLKTQYELKLISFDDNNHINFNNTKISNYNSDIWTEYHWYWFAYWKLHLSHNAISKIIQTASSLGGISGPLVTKIYEFIAGLLSSAIAMATAVIFAGFIIISFAVLLGYSNNASGCWIGILGIIPGVGWGSN